MFSARYLFSRMHYESIFPSISVAGVSEEERAEAEQLGEVLSAPADLLEEEAEQLAAEEAASAPAASAHYAWPEHENASASHSNNAHTSKNRGAAPAAEGANNENHVDADDDDRMDELSLMSPCTLNRIEYPLFFAACFTCCTC